MKYFSCEPWAALVVLFFTAALWDSCSAAAEDTSNISTTDYEPPCLNVNFCRQAAMCCPSGMDDYGWITAAVGWSLWFLTLILFCMDRILTLRPDGPKYLVA